MTLVQIAEEYAKKLYVANDEFHQWSHIQDVMKRAEEICAKLKDVPIDLEALQLAVIFHDIDYRTYEDHPDASVKVAGEFLSRMGVLEARISQIHNIMLDHSTPHRKVRGEAKTIEGKIIFDADKSIFITTPATYEKYFPLLYLQETRDLVTYKPLEMKSA